MATKAKKNELLVYGYVRDIERQKILQQTIPSLTIASVIILFYPWIDEFKWDQNNHGKNAIIVDDKTIEVKRKGAWAICISSNIISSDLCNWYKFQLELNTFTGGCIAIEFGFVATPIKNKISKFDTYLGEDPDDDHYSINISYANNFRIFGKGSHRQIMIKHDTKKEAKVHAQVGDKFRVRIDFIDKDIKLWYNDQYVNCCYKNTTPDSVVAAVSIYKGGITVIKTDYQ